MLNGAWSLNRDYAAEITVGQHIRNRNDGVTFWNWTCNLDLFRDDHKPSFELRLEFLNHTLFGLEVYNIHHLSPEEEESLYPNTPSK